MDLLLVASLLQPDCQYQSAVEGELHDIAEQSYEYPLDLLDIREYLGVLGCLVHVLELDDYLLEIDVLLYDIVLEYAVVENVFKCEPVQV